MDWVLLTYGVIFGMIALYLLTLWRRARKTSDQLKKRK